METNYTAYTRQINQETFYFVKKFVSFPEVGTEARVLDSYGMHRDFRRACAIASIYDEAIVHNLLAQLQIAPKEGRVVPIHHKAGFANNLLRNTQQAILRFRLAGS